MMYKEGAGGGGQGLRASGVRVGKIFKVLTIYEDFRFEEVITDMHIKCSVKLKATYGPEQVIGIHTVYATTTYCTNFEDSSFCVH